MKEQKCAFRMIEDFEQAAIDHRADMDSKRKYNKYMRLWSELYDLALDGVMCRAVQASRATKK